MVNILFVDDDKVTLRTVQAILEGAGYSVVAIADPRDAIISLERETFDLVITDANMPGYSGFDLVRAIRGHEKLAHLPVAFLTGRRDKKDIQQGVLSGADDYIIKPIDPLILLGKVESLLKKIPPEIGRQSQFPEGPVRKPATFDLEIEITYVSERGLTLKSTLIAPQNTKLKLHSPFFNQIGIDPPFLRVTGHSTDPSNQNIFFITANFIGLTDTDLQKIRAWLNTNFSPTKKIAI